MACGLNQIFFAFTHLLISLRLGYLKAVALVAKGPSVLQKSSVLHLFSIVLIVIASVDILSVVIASSSRINFRVNIKRLYKTLLLWKGHVNVA